MSTKKCPNQRNCPLIKSGDCPYEHPTCKFGVDCEYLKQRKCFCFHPKIHFAIVDSTTTYEPVSDNKSEKQYINIRDDESIINAIHPSKPVRHHKAWQKWEDAKLVKYIKTSGDKNNTGLFTLS